MILNPFLSPQVPASTDDDQEEQKALFDSFRGGRGPDCFIKRRHCYSVVDDTETDPEVAVEVPDSQTLQLEAGVDVDSNSNTTAITIFGGVTRLSIGSGGVLNAAGRDINNHYHPVHGQLHQTVVCQLQWLPLPPKEDIIRMKQRRCSCALPWLLLLGAIAILLLLTALFLPSLTLFPSFST